MDNNQQVAGAGTEQPASAGKVSDGVIAGAPVAPAVTNLGVNSPAKGTTAGPLTGKDVSMTTPQYAGGPITTTEPGSHA
jgi:hypothetical protein